RRVPRADVKLVDHQLVAGRGTVSDLVPCEPRGPHEARAGEGRHELPSVGGALETRTAPAAYVELVAVAVANSRNKTPPVAALVSNEQAGVVPLPVVELAADMDGERLRGPDAEGRATLDEIRTHRSLRTDQARTG